MKAQQVRTTPHMPAASRTVAGRSASDGVEAAASATRTTQAGLATSPRVLKQAAQLRAMYGPAVVQRTLKTHEKKNDEGKEVASLGDEGYFNQYARWLADDTSAQVDGEPKGEQGLKKTLKSAAIDGEAIAGQLVDSLMSSGAWKELNATDKGNMVAAVRESAGLPEMEETDTLDSYIADLAFATDYGEEVRAWILVKLSELSKATTIGAIGNIPQHWHADLAYLLYDATKDVYYIKESHFTPYMPPFKKLIADVNAGNITSFDYVRKYGAASQNWGAEFTVAAPAPMKDKYDGKAVLHTHYQAADEAPNYAHTKPEEKKYEAGFGYTIVDDSKVTAVSDSDETWDDL